MSVDVVTNSDPVEMDVLSDWRMKFNQKIPNRIPYYCDYCYRHPVSCLSYKDDVAWLCQKHHDLTLTNLETNK